MGNVVLDASAILAIMHDEPGADKVSPYLPGAYLSTVNAAEFTAKLVDGGANPTEAGDKLLRLGTRLVAFEESDVVPAARLRAISRSAGLSLADRACLTLARRLGVRAVTADREWATIVTDIEVELIR